VKNKVKYFVLEEKSTIIPYLIHTVAFDKASSEHLQDIVNESLTKDNLEVYEEKTQDP